MSKRSRDDNESPSWWTSTGDWIRSSGGTMHSDLVLTANRDVVTTTRVPKDSTLMEIPASCLVSRETVISTSTGALFESILNDESLSFSNQRQDLMIAMCLAAASQSDDNKFQRYLDTLPPSSEYDMLPRRWTDYELTNLLTGSCLLDRVMKSRVETKKDYETMKTAGKSNDADSFPSYSDFDAMLAAVTSRAFAGMGGSSSDEDIAMVPLLDLCNHRRGNVTKNVSYQKTPGGSVRVVAAEDLEADTVLSITYGARGNAQLLLNYGFCIPDNMEPDGSCNDVLEFKAKEALPPVDLRSGPKSYTFGGFAKVLEMFHDETAADQQNETNGGGFDGGMDDMEAFLNECDEEGEGGGWDDDEGDNGIEEEEPSEEETIKAELVALTAMQQAFEESKAKYMLKGDEVQQALAESRPAKRHYAAILVASELRTIFLYELGIEFVRAKLTNNKASDTVTCAVNLSDEDEKRVKKQAKELAQAFIGIRYPFL